MPSGKFIETRASKTLYTWLRTWSPSGKKVAIVYGPIGVGKTATIHYVAEKLGYEVVSADQTWTFQQLLTLAKARDWWGNRLIHLDRPYRELGLRGKQLSRLVKETNKPIVIETEDVKPYRWILGAEIRVEPPPKNTIAKLIRERALLKPNYKLLSADIRQAFFLGLGAGTYESRDWFDVLNMCLRKGVCNEIEQGHLPVILDTVVANCYGVECLEAIELLVAADLAKRPGPVLSGWRLPRPSQPVMYFYKRIKVKKELEEVVEK